MRELTSVSDRLVRGLRAGDFTGCTDFHSVHALWLSSRSQLKPFRFKQHEHNISIAFQIVIGCCQTKLQQGTGIDHFLSPTIELFTWWSEKRERKKKIKAAGIWTRITLKNHLLTIIMIKWTTWMMENNKTTHLVELLLKGNSGKIEGCWRTESWKATSDCIISHKKREFS